ncbi:MULTISPECIES: twin-arginine translocase TatA/TatE family subunit [unclassified Streptomyces]|uniref:twin-arginine translocase TatA/TatE family subunit n=1 Tax=unclassified Streptomyces TaxID=2593676 RepID=UPI000373DDA0|nr:MULTISPECIES: twin-arginine translocase TatA/TatE family subunit [unclassified Streptomyces]MYX38663.1 twin-arginine translocase TatA/TatE family subunit [Streptomyces sp. SID8377]
MFGLSELALLLVVVVVLIGVRKLPDLVRSAGKATRILKSEAAAMKADDDPAAERPAPQVIRAAPGDVIRRTDEVGGTGR